MTFIDILETFSLASENMHEKSESVSRCTRAFLLTSISFSIAASFAKLKANVALV